MNFSPPQSRASYLFNKQFYGSRKYSGGARRARRPVAGRKPGLRGRMILYISSDLGIPGPFVECVDLTLTIRAVLQFHEEQSE